MNKPWIVSTIFVVLIATAAIFLLLSQPSEPSSDEEEEVPVTEVKPGDEEGTLCELGKTYTRSASHQQGCVCPEGYVFDASIVGYNQCAGPGSECPILEVTCVEESGD